MKTRKEIEEQLSDMAVPAGQSATYRTMFDILLDIRELLKIMASDRREEEFRRARKLEELKRLIKQKGGESGAVQE